MQKELGASQAHVPACRCAYRKSEDKSVGLGSYILGKNTQDKEINPK
jgi:hypothetical protein